MAYDLELLDVYRKMLTIRRFEEAAEAMCAMGKIAELIRPCAGEEAVSVGTISALHQQDYLVSSYRQFAHYLTKGAPPRIVMAELFGKATGISRGRGGPVDLFDPALRFVSGGLPIATGLGLSIAYQEGQEVVACLFGDEVLALGAFHESLNMAALWNLPVIFVCENNFYGMGTIAPNAVAQEHLHKFAAPYQIPGLRVDGMDILEVHRAVAQAATRARAGEGPSLIEAVSYRSRGKTSSDQLESRAGLEERVWAARDPIRNLRQQLLTERGQNEVLLQEIEAEVEGIIADAVRFADDSPDPRLEDLAKDVQID